MKNKSRYSELKKYNVGGFETENLGNRMFERMVFEETLEILENISKLVNIDYLPQMSSIRVTTTPKTSFSRTIYNAKSYSGSEYESLDKISRILYGKPKKRTFSEMCLYLNEAEIDVSKNLLNKDSFLEAYGEHIFYSYLAEYRTSIGFEMPMYKNLGSFDGEKCYPENLKMFFDKNNPIELACNLFGKHFKTFINLSKENSVLYNIVQEIEVFWNNWEHEREVA